MAYQQTVRDDYRRNEVHEQRTKRSLLPLAILALAALAAALWAINRNRTREDATTRSAPMVTPTDRTTPSTTPSPEPRY